MENKLNAKQLRKTKVHRNNFTKVKRNPIYFILDNVIDTYNIGSLFRLADAVAAEKIFLCGDCEYPPSSKIHKAAVGTEAWVPWQKKQRTEKVVKELKKKGVFVVAVEQHKKAIDYRRLTKGLVKFPAGIIVGNETTGVSQEVLKNADLILELPMYGINKSFNVWGSAAVAVYKILEIFNKDQP